MQLISRLPSPAGRWARLGLAALMCLPLLAACGAEDIPDEQDPTAALPTAASPATAPPTDESQPAPASTDMPQPAGADGTWLVMLYQNADDEILEKDIFTDLNEAELVGSTEQVTLVAQLDRYQGAFDGDGDWTSTRRFLIQQDDDLEAIHSDELEDLGEVDSGDWQTLVDFAVWAIQTYPADKYALILSDHGAGWVGGWNDDDPNAGSSFSTDDIDRALGEIVAQTGVGQLDLLGFDACLMSQVESLAAVTPYARVAVASEEVEPALGWAYGQFLGELADNPGMSAADLGRAIVDSFIVGDGRITDDQARQVFVAENFGEGTEMSAVEVAEGMSADITLTAVDLGALPALNVALNELADALAHALRQQAVAEARAYAQAFETVFDEDQPPPYIDLGHFASLLEEGLPDDAAVTAAAQGVRAAIDQAVIAEKHGPQRPGATGFTLYFPNSTLYAATTSAGAQPGYTASASRFAAASVWDDFLRFHYTGETFALDDADPAALDPAAGAASSPDELPDTAPVTEPIVAPGAGESITIAPLTVSADILGVNDTLVLGTEINGGNVAYVYIYVSYYDEESGSYLTADMDFIGADETREVAGVFYPDWGPQGVGVLEVEWQPTVYFMSNGEQEEFAFFKPETYGASPEEDTYTVRGLYTFADSGHQRMALMRFGGDGLMQSVFGYTNEDGTGAPREITPRSGDTFTILEEWLEFDQDPEGEFVDYEGGTLTFNGRPFELVAYEAYPGAYTLGILVEDLNGNQQAEYVEITVTE